MTLYNYTVLQNMVCVDYLNLQRDRGMEESCGTVDSYADLESNNLRIEFRSNNKCVLLHVNNKRQYYIVATT